MKLVLEKIGRFLILFILVLLQISLFWVYDWICFTPSELIIFILLSSGVIFITIAIAGNSVTKNPVLAGILYFDAVLYGLMAYKSDGIDFYIFVGMSAFLIFSIIILNWLIEPFIE